MTRSREGVPNGFRQRRGALGDLIHSRPVFIGAPGLPDAIDPSTYPAFRNAQAGRLPMLVVGGNDGFVHVFNAVSGQELMAYAPNAVFPNLIDLTRPTYTHRYYVDGSPTAADVQTAGGWRTWVVGGLRAGGRGVYALDVTDPARLANAAASGNPGLIVQWEFTAADDADLGFTFSQPSVVRMQNGRWAALFGNGYNSPNDRAVLYVVFLDGGQDGTWTPGVDYVRIPATGGLPAPAGAANGLSTPAAVDLDRDFFTDLIYAGDLQGNLWKFDVSSPFPGNWGSAYRNGLAPGADVCVYRRRRPAPGHYGATRGRAASARRYHGLRRHGQEPGAGRPQFHRDAEPVRPVGPAGVHAAGIPAASVGRCCNKRCNSGETCAS